MKKVIKGFVILLVLYGCEQKAKVSEIEEKEQLHNNISEVIEEDPKDSVVDKTIKDDFNFTPFIEKIERISEIDTFIKRNENVKSLLEKVKRDSFVYYIIKMGVDTEYRFQTVYNFYIDSTTSKLFFLDVFSDSLIEVDSLQTRLHHKHKKAHHFRDGQYY